MFRNLFKNKTLFSLVLAVAGVCLSSVPALACLDAAALQTLASREMQYMLDRIPPAFADAVADHQIQGQMTAASGEGCLAHWQLTLPAADIAESQALLQADPAKRIMLAAQGYEIPDQSQMEAEFAVDSRLQVLHQETLQTAALGKLRASVELMYAMLTQARAKRQDAPPSSWTEPEQAVLQTKCRQQVNTGDTDAGCLCYVRGLAQQYSARQVRYNQYLTTNPYAFATGNGADFKQLEKSLRASCGITSIP